MLNSQATVQSATRVQRVELDPLRLISNPSVPLYITGVDVEIQIQPDSLGAIRERIRKAMVGRAGALLFMDIVQKSVLLAAIQKEIHFLRDRWSCPSPRIHNLAGCLHDANGDGKRK